MSKTCALVGMAATNRDLAPWDNEDIEIWTLNESPAKRFGYVKRVTRHFQLHPEWNWRRTGNQNDPEHAQWLKVQKFPIYMQDVYEDIPTSVKYPLAEVYEKFGITDGDCHWKEFTSTFPYMLALALYEDFDRIEIYGFEMGSETEYAYQRSAVHMWLGIARGLYLATGKPEIVIPDNCRLLGWGQPLYAYEMTYDLNPMEIEIDRNKYGNKAKELESQLLGLEGRQNEVKLQIDAITQSFQARAQEIQAKKQDPKLTVRRLAELEKAHAKEVAPLQQRVSELQNQKMNIWVAKEKLSGGEAAMIELLARYKSQKIPGLL